MRGSKREPCKAAALGHHLRKKQDWKLHPGHAQRQGEEWVDLGDTGEIQDSSMSVCFLQEETEMEME